MRLAATGVGLALAIMFISTTGISAQTKNVLLIIADDLGIDYASGFQSPLDIAPTPNIDQLASEGILFENAWSNPLCSPTRATIMTGKYGFRTGVGAPVGGSDNPGMSTDEYTLPDAIAGLAPEFYSTACIGKWHLGTYLTGGQDHPNLSGFDYFSGSLGGGVSDYNDWEKVVNGSNIEDNVATYASTENVNDAISWINSQENSWFLWLAFNAVHTPYHLPPDSLHGYDVNEEYSDDKDPVPYFNAAIEAMDTEIGRLLDHLRSAGQYEKTSVIYLGDNGTHLDVIQSPFNRRQGKGTLYEGGVHVPLIISGPEIVNPSRNSDVLVNMTDLYSTILSLIGVDNEDLPADAQDSYSLYDILRDQPSTERNWIYSESFNSDRNNGMTIRNEDYHLILEDDGDEEMYQVKTDIYEDENLLARSLSDEEERNYQALKRICDSIHNPGSYTSLEELEKDPQMNVWFSDRYHINIKIDAELLGSTLSIYDTSGKVIIREEIKNLVTRISLRQEQIQGIAIVHLQSEKGSYSSKIYK
ncbi:MAG: sulfatase-like hydrolase/transferase [Bacteroidetes bacterium]|nr:sulfatase-like hydrolase/transferase [Bacteroidota bacterium]